MAAAVGNQYAARGKQWRQAIERALAEKSRVDQVQALDVLATKLIELAANGDLSALKELGDRLDGKPAQSVAVTGEDGGPVQVQTINVLPVSAKSIIG
jgi:hypothetical protein